jgi:hypothetical protein
MHCNPSSHEELMWCCIIHQEISNDLYQKHDVMHPDLGNFTMTKHKKINKLQ